MQVHTPSLRNVRLSFLTLLPGTQTLFGPFVYGADADGLCGRLRPTHWPSCFWQYDPMGLRACESLLHQHFCYIVRCLGEGGIVYAILSVAGKALAPGSIPSFSTNDSRGGASRRQPRIGFPPRNTTRGPGGHCRPSLYLPTRPR